MITTVLYHEQDNNKNIATWLFLHYDHENTPIIINASPLRSYEVPISLALMIEIP